jgi:putative intracellular protease/amidase
MDLVEKGDQKNPTVAILLFDGAEVIDYAGPWEVFGQAGFKVFTVAEASKPIDAVFGQKIIPEYTFGNAPAADILLVPGGRGSRQAMQNTAVLKWLEQRAQASNYTMSVCTGALILGRAGLLDGLSATTFHDALDLLSQAAPKTHVVHDQRYVDNGKIITTAGLSSGIDGALHLVSKIKGKGFAQATALTLEYRWDPDSKFARAALADRYFPKIENLGGEIVSTDGDMNRWQFQILISKPNSAAAIIELISKQVVRASPHSHSVVVNPSTGSNNAVGWKFVDEKGRDWNGNASVESGNQAGKFLLTVSLSRQSI